MRESCGQINPFSQSVHRRARFLRLPRWVGRGALVPFMLLLAALCLPACSGIKKRPGLLEVLLPKPTGPMTVVSYNIRYGTASDGQNSWKNRRELLLASVRTLRPDVLCLQEALVFQVDELASELSMTPIGVGRDDGASAGEFTAILYRTDRFTHQADRDKSLGSGTFWLSPTPSVPGSKGWGATLPRTATLADLKELSSGKYLQIYNLHLDHKSERARQESVELLSRIMLERRRAGVPVIVAGDFNALPDSSTITYMLGLSPRAVTSPVASTEPAPAPRLVDSVLQASPNLVAHGTYHAFSGRIDGPRIDFIFADRALSSSASGVDTTADVARYPSDHFAVWATFDWPIKP